MTLLPFRCHGAGPVVLPIHGTAPDLFDELQRALSGDHTVVRVARRGFPGSGLEPIAALSPHADDLAQVLESVGHPALIVGWSIGGVIALELALRAPALVRGLVLIEPPWLAKSHPRPAMVSAILGTKLRAAFGRDAAAGKRFLRWALGLRSGNNELDQLSSSELELIETAGGAIAKELDGGTGEHLDRALTVPLGLPVRLLLGDQSSPVFAAAGARLAQRLDIEPEVIRGAGHLLQQTHASEVARVVRGITQLTHTA